MNQIHSIQYLRAIAALAVVYQHAAVTAGYPFWCAAGGVDLFFVISGFIMWTVAQDDKPAPFLYNRISRIVPIYWFYTALYLSLFLLLPAYFPRFKTDLAHIAASFTFVPARSPGDNGGAWPVLFQGWTLNLEMFFYCLFAAVLMLPKRWRLISMWGLLSALALAGTVYTGSSPVLLTYTSPLLLEFAFGMLVGWVIERTSVGAAVSIMMVLAGILLFVSGSSFLTSNSARVIAGGVPSALLIGGMVLFERSRGVPKWRLPLLLGNASYSIYLVHTFAISALGKIMPGHGWVFVAFSIFASAAAGAVSYCLLERPATRLGRSMIQRPATATA